LNDTRSWALVRTIVQLGADIPTITVGGKTLNLRSLPLFFKHTLDTSDNTVCFMCTRNENETLFHVPAYINERKSPLNVKHGATDFLSDQEYVQFLSQLAYISNKKCNETSGTCE